ncbi:MAG: grasp-with-spasm system ATP-grasp peptide maturase [Bacteroidetes bacterium]|nr:grasp-with-spasm system ATP-grasp peptide maturase [Bacteroidota bacterium]
MVLINSIGGDVSTTDIMRWLRHFGMPALRLSEKDQITNVLLGENNSFEITINNNISVRSDALRSYWYRRGQLNIAVIGKAGKKINSVLQQETDHYLRNDHAILLTFIYNELAKKKHIGSFDRCTFVNKLVNLSKAESAGLLTPRTIVTGSRKELLQFISECKQVITKPVAESFYYHSGNYWLPSYTKTITAAAARRLPSAFGHSLFQQRIEKKIEIRSFYLNGQFSSMAIFSQNDSKTTDDFRDYNYEKPNRVVPYQLPRMIEEKLDLVMRDLAYESGSIDILLDPSGQYYFLEINPVGQFGFLSLQCNHKIEKKIAQYLADE